MNKKTLIFRSEAIKIKNNTEMILEGYVVKWNELSYDIDGFRERVKKGAFKRSLINNDIKALYQHDYSKVLGSTKSNTLELQEDNIGLRYKAILNDTSWSKDCYECANDLDGVSFGFTIIEDNWIWEGNQRIRELLEVDLFEISFVTYPAYPSSEINKRSRRGQKMKGRVKELRQKINKRLSENNGMSMQLRSLLDEYSELEKDIKKDLRSNTENEDIQDKIDDLNDIALDIEQEIDIIAEKRNNFNLNNTTKINSLNNRDNTEFIDQNKVFRANDFKTSKEFRKAFTGTNNDKSLKIEDFAKGILFNDWKGNPNFRSRADGSVLLPTEIVSDVIYEATNKSVLLGNCPLLVMNEGKAIIGKIRENVDLDFKEKFAEGKKTSLGLEGVELEAKTLYAYIEIAEEDLQDLANLNDVIRKAFAGAIAETLDKNFLYNNANYGVKTGVYPKGILDNPNIKQITVNSVDYDMVGKACLEISKENGEANVVGLNPIEHYQLQMLKDNSGQYIQAPSFWNNLSKAESNAIKPSEAIVFDRNQIVIGIRQEMDIKTDNKLETGTVILRCMFRADVAPSRENHICKINIQAS